ncbi:MAG: DUF512 domain-containing protein [Clostridiales bacterium]|nr:DUF512 domain-containing protein [Clostridiales bacterium]
MKKKGHRIQSVDRGSIAEELEIEAGDRLLTVNGHEVEDIFDYEYYVDNESITLLIEKADGELWELEIENDGQDLGLNFENGLMSDYKSCSNKCIFCFIDQMPPGMRETLYFKDDDSRLSYLQGNYVTLTNMKDHDVQRIIDFKLAPINISVHTTNPQLRCEMLHNRFAGKSLARIDTLYEAGIPMNGQIVLCRDVNDGAELERTIRDLTKYIPCMQSVSVVPVGLTKYRDGLYPMKAFDRESAEDALQIIEKWQQKIFAEHGIYFIHASDEFYIMAEQELPEDERYDGYPQLENGVGMLRLLDTEVTEALEEMEAEENSAYANAESLPVGDDDNENAISEENVECEWDDPQDEERYCEEMWEDSCTDPLFCGTPEEESLSLATGMLAYPYIKRQIEKITERYPQKTVHLYAIRNDFFGDTITVAGLITGQDIEKQLTGKNLGSRLLLPACMFRSGEDVFLDDVSLGEVETALQVPVNIVKSSGRDLVRTILYAGSESSAEHGEYELQSL